MGVFLSKRVIWRLPWWSMANTPASYNWKSSVMSNSLWLHGLYSPWNSLGQNTGVGSLFFLQGISTTQGLNPGLLHYRQILYQLSHKGSSAKVKVIMEDNGPLIQHDWSLYQRRLFREFPGSPWLQPPSAEGWGLIPGQGTRIPHAATKDPTCHNYDLAQTKYISNFKKKEKKLGYTHIQHHVKMKPETGVMYLQPKEC